MALIFAQYGMGDARALENLRRVLAMDLAMDSKDVGQTKNAAWMAKGRSATIEMLRRNPRLKGKLREYLISQPLSIAFRHYPWDPLDAGDVALLKAAKSARGLSEKEFSDQLQALVKQDQKRPIEGLPSQWNWFESPSALPHSRFWDYSRCDISLEPRSQRSGLRSEQSRAIRRQQVLTRALVLGVPTEVLDALPSMPVRLWRRCVRGVVDSQP